MEFFTDGRIAAILLIGSGVVFLVAGYLFTTRVIWRLSTAQTELHLRWERGSVIAAFLISMVGFAALESALRATGGAMIARMALVLYVVSASLMSVAETTFLNDRTWVNPQLVVHVALTFLAQATFGAALLWIGKEVQRAIRHDSANPT